MPTNLYKKYQLNAKMYQESNLPTFTKVKDLQFAKAQEKFNLNIKLITAFNTISKTPFFGSPIVVGIVADETGCIDVKLKDFNRQLPKEGSYLTLVGCEFSKSIEPTNVWLNVSTFFVTQQENFKPKSVNLHHNVTIKITQKFKKNLNKPNESEISRQSNISQEYDYSSDSEAIKKSDEQKQKEKTMNLKKDTRLNLDNDASQVQSKKMIFKEDQSQIQVKKPHAKYDSMIQPGNTPTPGDSIKNGGNMKTIPESKMSKQISFSSQEDENQMTQRISILQSQRKNLIKLIPQFKLGDALQINRRITAIEQLLNILRLKLVNHDFKEEGQHSIISKIQKTSMQEKSYQLSEHQDEKTEMRRKSSEKQEQTNQKGFFNKIKSWFSESQEEQNQHIQQLVPPSKPNMTESKIFALQKLGLQKLHDDEPIYYKKQTKIELINDKKTIKNHIKIYSVSQKQGEPKRDSKFNFQDVKIDQVWNVIEKASEKCPQASHLICDEVMNEPISKEKVAASDELKKIVKQQAKKQPGSLANTITNIAQMLESSEVPVILTKNSTVQSKISLRALTGQFMENAVKVQQRISDEDPDCPYLFMHLYDPDNFESFCRYYKNRVSKQTNISPQKIYISSVTKGSTIIEWITDDTDSLFQIIDSQPGLKKKYQIHTFFKEFHLCPEDFDQRGDIKFFDQKQYVQTRGGWPYYQPIKCKRYGINVSKKYDRGDDTWLMMNGKPGEWAVAFHGVKAPKSFKVGQPKVLKLIMDGLLTGTMLKVGEHQHYKDFPAQNKRSQKVGKGIYCTPHIQSSFDYADRRDEYALVFQCRVNPKAIKVCSSKEEYWVINDTKNIRPYGIVLIKKDVLKDYPSVEKQFSKVFRYKKFRKEIEKYIKSY